MVSADTEFGVFTDEGPWVLDPENLTWKSGLAQIRAELQAALPELIRPRKVPPGARVGTTVRHLGGALALWYVTERRRGGSEKIAGISRRLRLAAEQLGPTYIKLGQIVASGDGIFPPELVAEFKWCRDQVRPEPWPVIERVLIEELGRPLSEVFSSHRPCSPRGRVHRPGPRRTIARRDRSGREGPAPLGRPAGAPGPRRDGVARSPPGGPDPDCRVGQSPGPGGALRRDHRGGARLPTGSREHARHRIDVRQARANATSSSLGPTPRS